MTRQQRELEDLMVSAAELYYYEGLTQSAVAEQLATTRWTVGRLLEDAKAAGIVRVVIDHPRARRHELEVSLKARFDLREVIVVAAQPNAAVTFKAVCSAAARHLAGIRPQVKKMAVSWGRTVAGIAAELPDGWAKSAEIIQTNGGPTVAKGNPVGDSLYHLAEKAGGQVVGLAGPTIVQNTQLAHLLRSDPAIAGTLKQAEACRLMLYSPGAATPDSVLVRSGYITADQMKAMGAGGVAGDVMSHFIGPDGRPADPDLDQRTLSISLDAVRRCPSVIAVANGEEKKAAVQACVTAGLCTTLITDSSIANALLAKPN